jgi:hypothetical protein
MKLTLLSVSVLLVLTLAGCGGGSKATATITAPPVAPIVVVGPTAGTPTEAPTAGPSTTPTADLSAFAQTELKTGTGFSVQIPTGFVVTHPEGGVFAIGKGYLIGFFFQDFPGGAVLQDALAKFFDELAARDFVLQHGDPYKLTVNGKDALAADFTGKIGQEPVAGQVIVFSPVAGKVFLAVGMAGSGQVEQVWAQTGHALFEKLLGTVTVGP